MKTLNATNTKPHKKEITDWQLLKIANFFTNESEKLEPSLRKICLLNFPEINKYGKELRAYKKCLLRSRFERLTLLNKPHTDSFFLLTNRPNEDRVNKEKTQEAIACIWSLIEENIAIVNKRHLKDLHAAKLTFVNRVKRVLQLPTNPNEDLPVSLLVGVNRKVEILQASTRITDQTLILALSPVCSN